MAASERNRALVLRHGWNSTCYQLLNDGIEHWWSADGQSMVGFVRSGGMAIVAGAPVCAAYRLDATLEEWDGYLRGQGLQACYFGAESRLQDCLDTRTGYVNVVLGSQPEWDPAEFVALVEGDASLRAQLNRARNKHVQVSEWSRERAEHEPALKAVLQAWLATRGLPTLHFLVEPETLGDLRDRRIFVAERHGRPIGFVTLCPVPARRGWLTEQFVRGPEAPNGTVELLLYHSAKAVAEAGALYFTMGIVPLVANGAELDTDPTWLRLVRGWARAHYTRFYNFRGLAEFKGKFHPPHWQPVVVVIQGDRFRLKHLRAIGRAFTVGPPELAVAKGCAKALREELRRFAAWLSHR
ncbi:MAG: DUF2156 domain-containing protein [Fimbriimonadaceae bacterium]|nr:DUF2156 domain-containing protein [Fimbriimonadaceae bacterium]